MSLAPAAGPQGWADFALESEAELVRQALRALDLGLAGCSCPGRYHALWGLVKLSGASRGLYREAPLLARSLAPLVRRARRLLVGGAADATSLRFLLALAGSGSDAHWSVADACPAVLALVREDAQVGRLPPERLQLLTQDLRGLAGLGPRWDFQFLHYTLSFMAREARRDALAALRDSLSPDGQLACVVKCGAGLAEAQAWQQGLRRRLAPWLAAQPRMHAALEAHLPAYAAAREQRDLHQPGLASLREDFEAAGLRLLAEQELGASGETGRSTHLLLACRA